MTINTQKITTLIRDGCHGTYMYHVYIAYQEKIYHFKFTSLPVENAAMEVFFLQSYAWIPD